MGKRLGLLPVSTVTNMHSKPAASAVVHGNQLAHVSWDAAVTTQHTTEMRAVLLLLTGHEHQQAGGQHPAGLCSRHGVCGAVQVHQQGRAAGEASLEVIGYKWLLSPRGGTLQLDCRQSSLLPRYCVACADSRPRHCRAASFCPPHSVLKELPCKGGRKRSASVRRASWPGGLLSGGCCVCCQNLVLTAGCWGRAGPRV